MQATIAQQVNQAKGPQSVQQWLQSQGLQDHQESTQNGIKDIAGDLLRSLMQINPNLFPNKNEQDVRKEIAGVKKREPNHASAQKNDIVGKILSIESQLKEEQAQIQMAQAKLQEQAEALSGKYLQIVFSTLLQEDPNLVSPKTLEILSLKGSFFTAIGFTPKKMIEWQIQRQSK